MTAPNWTPAEFKALLDDFGSRLATDADFAARAQADAPAAMREVAGRELPDGADRFRLTPTADGLALGAPEAAGGELSDGDLEQVVGGVSGREAAATVLLLSAVGAYAQGKEAHEKGAGVSGIGKSVLFGAIAGAGLGVAVAAHQQLTTP